MAGSTFQIYYVEKVPGMRFSCFQYILLIGVSATVRSNIRHIKYTRDNIYIFKYLL